MTEITADMAHGPTDSNGVRKHGPLARIFHWGFVAVFVYAVYKGLDDVTQLQDTALLQFEMLFAGGFLLLLIARFFYMRWAGPTVVPEGSRISRLARLGHLAMYASVGLIAVTGLGIGALYGAGITAGPILGLVIMLHETVVTTSYILVGGHIAAALFHRLKGDGIWSAMVPVWTEKTPD